MSSLPLMKSPLALGMALTAKGTATTIVIEASSAARTAPTAVGITHPATATGGSSSRAQ